VASHPPKLNPGNSELSSPPPIESSVSRNIISPQVPPFWLDATHSDYNFPSVHSCTNSPRNKPRRQQTLSTVVLLSVWLGLAPWLLGSAYNPPFHFDPAIFEQNSFRNNRSLSKGREVCARWLGERVRNWWRGSIISLNSHRRLFLCSRWYSLVCLP